MKSLQKLGHSRPTSPAERARLRLVESERVAQRERRIWIHRARRSVPFLIAAGLIALAVFLVVGLRRVADGLVLAHRVELTAPARVRVAETYVRPGEECSRGDALIRLEAVTGAPERRRLEALIESRRQRLEWFDAGGEAEEFGRTLRADLVAEARREAGEADSERIVARARLESLRRERAELELSLAEEIEWQRGAVTVLADREAEAAALVREVQTKFELAGLDVAATEQLLGEGVVSERDVVSSRRELDATTFSAERTIASARALRGGLKTARNLVGITEERLEATLALADARVEAARREVLAADRRAELWRGIETHHMRYDPGPIDVPRLQELRHSVLAAELAEAQAQLAEHDDARGEKVLVAQTDGVVDRVFAVPGAVLEEGGPLLAYNDPGALRVVAYVTPELAPAVTVGQKCRLVAEGDRSEVDAVVASIGSAWTECPTSLPRRTSRTADLRVPVVIECASAEAAEHFRPNMRLKITFSGGGLAAFRRQLWEWFGG